MIRIIIQITAPETVEAYRGASPKIIAADLLHDWVMGACEVVSVEESATAGDDWNNEALGKRFSFVGFGGPELQRKAKEEGLTLWALSRAKGHADEFTRGWTGCDPGQLYFAEVVSVEEGEPATPLHQLAKDWEIKAVALNDEALKSPKHRERFFTMAGVLRACASRLRQAMMKQKQSKP